ncbi:hypothetical protein FOZ60_010796 [Perkinsus olseni]|uniref:Uncharacterized protein n=1 Tax=Perkinsus olseni TaxID=32597 RepID=A0A7J6NGV4_PEROL|nr:hypothetical protein FOZ60_010796 [Perkinsus olseni]
MVPLGPPTQPPEVTTALTVQTPIYKSSDKFSESYSESLRFIRSCILKARCRSWAKQDCKTIHRDIQWLLSTRQQSRIRNNGYQPTHK